MGPITEGGADQAGRESFAVTVLHKVGIHNAAKKGGSPHWQSQEKHQHGTQQNGGIAKAALHGRSARGQGRIGDPTSPDRPTQLAGQQKAAGLPADYSFVGNCNFCGRAVTMAGSISQTM